MVKLQIIEKEGADLYKKLIKAMRAGDLRTFSATKHGRKITHTNYPGWMNWSNNKGVIVCKVLSPRRKAGEWQLLSAFIGRLADRYNQDIQSINIQFSNSERTSSRRRR